MRLLGEKAKSDFNESHKLQLRGGKLPWIPLSISKSIKIFGATNKCKNLKKNMPPHWRSRFFSTLSNFQHNVPMRSSTLSSNLNVCAHTTVTFSDCFPFAEEIFHPTRWTGCMDIHLIKANSERILMKDRQCWVLFTVSWMLLDPGTVAYVCVSLKLVQ